MCKKYEAVAIHYIGIISVQVRFYIFKAMVPSQSTRAIQMVWISKIFVLFHVDKS
jgi:hypothetical protein